MEVLNLWELNERVIDFHFDLQLFAAEDEGRTEEPTETKKRKAREEGNLPRSPELTGIIVFLIGFWTVSIIGEFIFNGLLNIMRYYMENLLTIKVTNSSFTSVFVTILSLSGSILLPLMLVGVISSIIGNVIQGGFVFTTKKIGFNPGKIISNMGQNFSKMFWSRETIFNLIKSLAKVFGVFFIALLIINNRLSEILNMSKMELIASFGLLWNIIFQFVSFAGVLLLVFAIADYAFQRWVYNESLKMSKQEIKEEFKEQEGDPEIKAKIREMERRILSRKMVQEVPKADVIITNPTHIAIALKYDQVTMNAPVIIAKGEGTMAQKIKEIAKEHNIFIIENI